MIAKIIEFSVRRRGLVILFFAFVGVLAVRSLQTAHVDAIPDIGENQQIALTEWPGRSPKDVEEQITYPLSVHLQGLPGVKSVRGASAFGFSTVYVVFEDDVDFYWSRSRVLEKLSTAGALLPDGVTPTMGPDATGLGQVFWYTLENSPDSPNPLSLAELRSLQDFYVRYHLQGVTGVSEVASVGGFVKEYQIDVDPKKLFAYGTHLTALVKAIQESNADVGAEVVEEGDREFIVRGKGFFRSLEDIEDVVIAVKASTPVRVKDVARVSVGPAFRRGALDVNGQEAVGGVVTMRFGENPKVVIDALKERIKTVEQGLPAGVSLVPFYDRSELIERSIHTVSSALVQEVIVTVAVILLFLSHFGSSALVSLTLPFGVGISFILMKALDIDSNIMSLAGLVIAIGSMVDMGIIMTESIYAALAKRPNADRAQRLQIAMAAAKEVGPPISVAVTTTIISFLPVFLLEGAEGKLFGPLAWAKTLAMFGAALVAIVFIPAMSPLFLRGKLAPIEKNKASSLIMRVYTPCLSWLLERQKLFFAISASLVFLGGFAYSKIGSEFMPSLNEGDIMYMPTTTPDVSMTQAKELLAYTDRVLSEHPLVEKVVGKLGRAESALDPAPIAMLETIVRLVPQSEWPLGVSVYDIMEELDQSLQVPGLVNSWDFPIQTRIGMISTGIKTQVGIKIFGNDLERLEELAGEVGRVVGEVEGAYGIYAEKISGKPYIEFDIDRVAASRYGINTGDVNRILQTAVGGMVIGQFYEGRERYPIRARYKKEFRDRVDELKQILVPSPLGHHIPITQLADIRVTTGPAAISSENGMLRAAVMLNVKDRDLSGFVAQARLAVSEKVDLPPGYSIVWAGEYEKQIRANKRLLLLLPLSLAVNILIIYWGLGNLRNSAIVFAAIPVVMAGGMIFLWLGGFNASVAVWVGFIALFGIAVDDGVVMMTYLQTEIKKSPPANWAELKEMIINAGRRRIRPLLMTSVTTIVALLPVMWATTAGSEIIKPMAIPVLGGMLFQLMALFMTPLLFAYFEKRKLMKAKF